jgi:large subunit ribosomal protein L25
MHAKPTSKGKLELTAHERDVVGRQVKQLRAEGIMPAVLYGRGQETLSLQIPMKDFEQVFAEAGESTLVYLNVGTASFPTIIHEVAKDPVTGQYLHADFHKVRLDEKVEAMVPLVFVGESPAVKNLNGVLVKNLTEVEVEAFPQDLPPEIEVDISKLEQFEDHITLGDVKLEKAEIVGEPDEYIVMIQEPKSQEELEAELAEPTTDVESVEVEQKEGEEATAPGEGEAAPADEKKEETPAE